MSDPSGLELLMREAEDQLEVMGDESPELIQYLVELGYLSKLPMMDLSNNERLETGFAAFMHDFEEEELVPKSQMVMLKSLYPESFAEELLRKLMDLDEGFHLPSLPEYGSSGLRSRIIHYRLKVYGLISQTLDKSFSFMASSGLQTLKNYVANSDPLQAINLIANKEALIKRLLSIYGDERFLLFFHINQQEDGLNPDFKKLHSEKNFYRQLERSYDPDSRFVKAVWADILTKKSDNINWEYIKGRSNDSLNKLIVRIIQVHQWMDGFYEGDIEGEIGALSLNSIGDLVEFYNAGEKDDVSLKAMLFHISDQYFAFNALFFLKHYMIEDVPKDHEQSTIDQLLAQSGKLSDKDRAQFEQNLEEVVKASNIELQKDRQNARRGVIKHLYHGVRSFFKKLFRIGKRLVKMILKNLKKVFNQLKNFFKRILEFGRQALRSFVRGIKYILGRLPIVSKFEERLAVTKSEFMGDTFNLINEYLDGEEILKHEDEVNSVQRAAQFSMAILSEVLKLLKFAIKGFIGWPILLLQLARAAKAIYQKHQLIYEQ